jgi:hypothetical protein
MLSRDRLAEARIALSLATWETFVHTCDSCAYGSLDLGPWTLAPRCAEGRRLWEAKEMVEAEVRLLELASIEVEEE